MATTTRQEIIDRFLQIINEVVTARTPKYVFPRLSFTDAIIRDLQKGNLQVEQIAEFCIVFECSAEWVITGKGERFLTKEVRTIQEELVKIRETIGNVLQPLIEDAIQIKVGNRTIRHSDIVKNISKS